MMIDTGPHWIIGNVPTLKDLDRHLLTGLVYQAYQGKFLGRDGRIFVEFGDKIVIGGECNTVFSGKATYNVERE